MLAHVTTCRVVPDLNICSDRHAAIAYIKFPERSDHAPRHVQPGADGIEIERLIFG